MDDEGTAKSAARRAVDEAADALVDLSHRIWDHPELAFEEERTSAAAAEVLADAGFDVRAGVADLPTAFVAEAGSGPAGRRHLLRARRPARHRPRLRPQRDRLLGGRRRPGAAAGGRRRSGSRCGCSARPAEEIGGGKILMLERGAFDGIHLAMMVHPTPAEGDSFPTLAISQFDFHFHGKTAHASLAPHLGVNAADAITVAQVALGLLRQHLHPGDQLHGIVTRGGEAANVVPGQATARYFMRAPTLESLAKLEPRVRALLRGRRPRHRRPAGGRGARTALLRVPPRRRAGGRSTARNAEQLGRRFRDERRSPRRVDRHGEHQPAAADDPPDARPRLVPRRQPPARVRRPLPDARSPTRRWPTGAVAMAWTAVDAAAPGRHPRAGCSALRTPIYGGRSEYPWRFA